MSATTSGTCTCGPACTCPATTSPGTAARRVVQLTRVTLPLFDLGCGSAGAVTAERMLSRTPGVVHAYVSPATEMAYVEFDASVCDTEALKRAVKRAGLRTGPPGFR